MRTMRPQVRRVARSRGQLANRICILRIRVCDADHIPEFEDYRCRIVGLHWQRGQGIEKPKETRHGAGKGIKLLGRGYKPHVVRIVSAAYIRTGASQKKKNKKGKEKQNFVFIHRPYGSR
jgi:hypothetical protein